MMLLADAIGWGGAACLLLAYAGLSSGRLTAGLRYQVLNLAGAGGLVVDGAFRHAWPSTALNVVWLGIGLAAARRAKRTGVQAASRRAKRTGETASRRAKRAGVRA
ncbi:CBU_0592 family membrane protein [Rugosimonospora africana]|uniref:CBU-0592-like domain-containing protein n=1 Tax=Rugosimonospora africana TaxID=556532 RepID=A0A8J3VUN6_9ACTN|nr:hypothetical protein [Rugosimonospora africana]GIH19465.1 hypothetical protein Raf01_76370 [Rugosimonospora africana]